MRFVLSEFFRVKREIAAHDVFSDFNAGFKKIIIATRPAGRTMCFSFLNNAHPTLIES